MTKGFATQTGALRLPTFGGFPKIGVQYPKMEGLKNNGKPYFVMDDLGGKSTISGNTHFNHCSTLPETNSSHLKSYLPKRKLVFQPSIFRGELLVLGRVFPFVNVGPRKKHAHMQQSRL